MPLAPWPMPAGGNKLTAEDLKWDESTCVKTFKKHNDELKRTMKSHFIDIEKDGVWENDYDKFYHARLKRISRALNKFIIRQNEFTNMPLEVYEDIEEPEVNTVD